MAVTRTRFAPSPTGYMHIGNLRTALYEYFCNELLKNGVKAVKKGIFGADMKVSLINDGPVTITYDTDLWLG